jgi:hypothetical protein
VVPVYFIFIIFEIGSPLCSGQPGGPKIYSSIIAGMTDAYHYTQQLVEMGVSQTFCPGWHLTTILPSSYDFRLEPYILPSSLFIGKFDQF